MVGARMRPRQILATATLVFIIVCLVSFSRYSTGTDITKTNPLPASAPQHGSPEGAAQAKPPPPPPAPAPLRGPNDPQPKPAPAGRHPMQYLIAEAQKDFEALRNRQSKTLDQAVAEYRKRYGIPPPPNFDKWFAFAQSKNVQLIDEFDTIHETLTPFWGLKPSTIRQRAKEALGFDNQLLGVLIRDGKVTHAAGGGDWQRDATTGMMSKFVRWLPSMDLCFNLHDEPRVVVPHDDMVKLVKKGKEVAMPAAGKQSQPLNAFSKPAGLGDGKRFEEAKLTRFNVFAHQPTWTHSRLSCPPDSPSRGVEDEAKADDISKYSLGELGFVYNVTASSDICNSPSLSSSFGFFDRPNAYNIVHDLFPIFSQSKISSYSDILYPSPWYWYGKVTYSDWHDWAWKDKADKFYWRGSTTGGFSRNGGWRRQHRQRFVQKTNAADQAKIMVNTGTEDAENWKPKTANRGDFRDIMDIFFSHVGQCDPGDCEAQQEFFTVMEHADQHDAYKYKYLLDIDGNAFSGRFYAFLKSKSLVYKWAVFREWHSEWLKPWAHYIPLSLQGDDWLEAVRFFSSSGAAAQKEAERLAVQQREWANKVLRNDDFEVWFFRLLLEYGRVIDDDREKIGFSTGGRAAAPAAPRGATNMTAA